MKIRPKGYEVLLTPLISLNRYANEIDVTSQIDVEKFIKDKGITSIRREVDNGDFDFGVFTYNSLTITFLNYEGKFSDNYDSRSIFKYTRDKAKIKINFYDGKSNVPVSSFKGIVDDRATTIDFLKMEVQLTVLSEDSIFNRVTYLEGSVAENSTINDAIYKLLNRPEITEVLNVSRENINPQNDYGIDNVADFSGKLLRDIFNDLMIASNSIMYIDKNSNVIVRTRTHNSEFVFELFGSGDELGRNNIFDISEYNTGLQRTFTTVKFGEEIYRQDKYAKEYGDFTKSLDIACFSNSLTRLSIAKDISEHFKAPKIELVVTCKTEDVNHLEFFDLIQLHLDYEKKGYNNTKLPVYNQAKYNEAIYPHISGMKISSNVAFKIIGIEENTQNFYTKLKLRQVGETYEDGYFTTMRPNNIPSKYGLAIYGVSKYSEF